MSIDAAKSVTTISGLVGREAITEQQKNQTAVIPTKNYTNVSANVNLSQNVMTQLHATDNDIDVKKIARIKQTITNGTLVIDSQKITKELIQQVLQHIEK